MKKLFNKDGFTDEGFAEYGKLRAKGVKKEKAIKMLIKRDKTIKLCINPLLESA